MEARAVTICDVAIYNGEREPLEIRLRELAGVVDLHLIVEGDRTFSGAPRRPTLVDDLRALPAFAHAPVLGTVVRDWPEGDAWAAEERQRNAMAEFVETIPELAPDTVILLSDIDEVPKAHAVPTALDPGVTFRLGGVHTMYFVNAVVLTWGAWFGTRCIRLDDLRNTTPQTLRGFGLGHTPQPGDKLDAAYHFSFLGGLGEVRRKLAQWSHHSESEEWNTNENVDRALHTLTDWNPQRGAQIVAVPLERAEVPDCVRREPERFSVYPCEVPA